VKLRIGVLLWILSWIPYGWILGLDGAWLTVSLTFEILLGIAGIALAGSEFGQAVKTSGWKRAPGIAWRALIHGSDVEDLEDVDVEAVATD
jgi:hypothetical protein